VNMQLTRTSQIVVAAAAVVCFSARARADVKVGPLVGDHMVVQQGRPVRLGGTAAPGEAVTATLGAARATTKADAGGLWSLALAAPPAGGPFTLAIAATNRLEFTDVWSGEVWVAAGQSNMEFPLNRARGGADAGAAGCPGLRLFMVSQTTAATPRAEAAGEWKVCDAATAAAFSAVAFHFGRELHRALGVPIGLVQASWGGTPAESWTPREALVADPSLRPLVDALDQSMNDRARRDELARALAAWEKKSFHQDTGNRGEKLGWAAPAAPARGWSKMDLPQLWEQAGLAIDGAVWFRREVTLPDGWAGADLALSLGTIDDFDVTYWNGERVGSTGEETPQYWMAPRRYRVPGRLVKAGRNIVAVRVFDHYGNGGLGGTPAQLGVRPAAARPGDGEALPLAGSWSYRIERRLPPIVVDWSTRPKALGTDDPESPTVLWNGMMAPLAGLPAAGVIWYQGETNVARAAQYRTLFPAMIRAWRAAWRDPRLPCLFVQLPNFEDALTKAPLGEGAWAELREAQALALREPRTSMAVTLDIGESGDIHPREKHEVGRRLALAALRSAYGRDVIASGPTFVSATREGRAMRVRFAGVAGGLTTVDGAAPRGFLLAGPDRVWRVASARIDGSSVIVSSPDVPEPAAVRYGWGNDPPNTLRNQADLPAAPFRTDDWQSGAVSTNAR